MPKLILMFKDKILNAYSLVEGGALTIGRHMDNDIIIENLTVSGHHARVAQGEGGIVLTDLNSKNGTRRNGVAITECRLEDRDTITIGKHTLQADWSDTIAVERSPEVQADPIRILNTTRTMVMKTPGPPREEARPAAPPPPPPAAPRPRTSEDRLVFLAGGEGVYALSKSHVSIGKNSDADIVIGGTWALLLGSPAAVITKQSGDYFLRYTNGLIRPKRNGASVKGTVKLNHDDVVEIGPVKLRIQLGQRLAV